MCPKKGKILTQFVKKFEFLQNISDQSFSFHKNERKNRAYDAIF